MKKAAVLFALLATLSAPAQTTLLTECQYAPGQRSLTLTGFFQDADTVFLQVYHDGEVLADMICVKTFALTLGEYDQYDLKFTDALQRVKRITIRELSDDQIEFLPPIEVDFGRTGNVVLIKPSTGKPDFVEYDVGMSRKQR